MRRGRIIPTTVTYERKGNVALIHLTGFNSATTETLTHALDRARARDRPRPAGHHPRHALESRRPARPGPVGVRGVHRRRRDLLDPGPPSRQPADLPEWQPQDRRAADGGAGQRQLSLGGRDRRGRPQDRGRAAVVGTTSYGKGTVQTVIRLPNEGELVLTWSRLLAPSGYTWNEQGVMPNICTAKVGDLGLLAPELGRRQQARCCSAGMPSAIPASRRSQPAQDLPAGRGIAGAQRRYRRPSAAGTRRCMPTPCAPARSSRPPCRADPAAGGA